MIHYLKASQRDEEEGSALHPCVPDPSLAAVDFSKTVVRKPWGYEYLVYANPFVQVWHLFIRPGAATSLHCHPQKKSAIVVLDGDATLASLAGEFQLGPLDGVVIGKKVFHSTRAASEDGVHVLEVETPPIKHDLVRLRDQYGREQRGYEGLHAMVFSDRHRLDPLRFTQVVEREYRSKRFRGKTVGVLRLNGRYRAADIERIKRHDIGLILGGEVSRDGAPFCSVADIVTTDAFLEEHARHGIGDLSLMLIRKE